MLNVLRAALRPWLGGGVLMLMSLGAWADDYSAGWGPALGAPMPLLAAPDDSGQDRTLADLTGDQGLLLFLSRSADW
jgi:hypothetical protein